MRGPAHNPEASAFSHLARRLIFSLARDHPSPPRLHRSNASRSAPFPISPADQTSPDCRRRARRSESTAADPTPPSRIRSPTPPRPETSWRRTKRCLAARRGAFQCQTMPEATALDGRRCSRHRSARTVKRNPACRRQLWAGGHLGRTGFNGRIAPHRAYKSGILVLHV